MQSISFTTGGAGYFRGLANYQWVVRFLSGAFLLLLAPIAQSQDLPEVPELDTVLAEKRFEIQQQCLPVHYRDGAAEYINCVRTKIANEKTASALVLDRFSFDDKYALQQSCAEYYGRNEVYTECLKSEIDKLDSIPEPNLTALNNDELNALQQNCFEDQKSRGAPAYRTCLTQALARMLEIPRVDLSGLTAVEINEMKLFCSNSSRQLKNANYRLCLAEALAAKLKIRQAGNKTLVEAVLPTEAINPAASQASTELVDGSNSENFTVTEINNESLKELSIDSTGNVSEGSPATVADDAASLSSNQQQPSVVTTTLPDPNRSILESGAGGIQNNETTAQLFSEFIDDPVGTLRTIEIQQFSKYLIFILPLVILLVCVKLLRVLLRRRKNEETPVTTGVKRQSRTDLFDEPAFGTNKVNTDFLQEKPESAEHDHRLDFLQDTNEPEAAAPKPSAAPETLSRQSSNAESQVDLAPAPLAPPATTTRNNAAEPVYQVSEFSQWISNKPVPEIKRLCTEFMLYWISYGEGNYSQNLKNHLLHSQDLNDHDQIKKWVLEQNPSAVVDLLKQLREIFSTEEIRQTIKLMMAVLVKNEISPVQNTFLRFLVDFTNIGREWLDQEYQASFGQSLPPLPRPDDERWWQNLPDPDKQAENSAGQDGESSGRMRCLKQLGLHEPASGEDIANAYHRIALRCHPERFDQLGEKERNLALRYFDRCTEAHNFLLELEK